MSSYQKQYSDILYNLIYKPLKKRPSRIGNIHGNFFETIRVDLTKEFPLMELKKIQFSNILHELLWFVKGNTHIKYLVDNGCNIWTDDSYRYYLEQLEDAKKHYVFDDGEEYPMDLEPLNKEEFIAQVKRGNNSCGQLDRIYGKQWREFNGQTDQLQNCIETLMKNPDDRRMIVTAHNPTDIENKIVGLPSCHNMFQFYTVPLTLEERITYAQNHYSELKMLWQEKQLDEYNVPKFYLCTWFNIRSNDFLLGQPYNIASYALLTHIVANIVNMIPKEVVCSAIDCHLYEAHIPAAKEFLTRYHDLCKNSGMSSGTSPYNHVGYCKSNLVINRKLVSIDDVKAEDISLENYNPQSYIKAPLLT